MNPKRIFEGLVKKYQAKVIGSVTITIDFLQTALKESSRKGIANKTNLEWDGYTLRVPWMGNMGLGYLYPNEIKRFLDGLVIKNT
jgi:hypothetical protein